MPGGPAKPPHWESSAIRPNPHVGRLSSDSKVKPSVWVLLVFQHLIWVTYANEKSMALWTGTSYSTCSHSNTNTNATTTTTTAIPSKRLITEDLNEKHQLLHMQLATLTQIQRFESLSPRCRCLYFAWWSWWSLGVRVSEWFSIIFWLGLGWSDPLIFGALGAWILTDKSWATLLCTSQVSTPRPRLKRAAQGGAKSRFRTPGGLNVRWRGWLESWRLSM